MYKILILFLHTLQTWEVLGAANYCTLGDDDIANKSET